MLRRQKAELRGYKGLRSINILRGNKNGMTGSPVLEVDTSDSSCCYKTMHDRFKTVKQHVAVKSGCIISLSL